MGIFEIRPFRFLFIAVLALVAYAYGGLGCAVLVGLASMDVRQ